jgi:epoxyqueuosine reductase
VTGADRTADPASQQALGSEVVRACLSLGFAAAGIARALPSDRPSALGEWLAAGRHGDMDWLAADVEERLDPRRLVPGAVSIVVVADQYELPGSRHDPRESGDAKHGHIARYARGLDYHRVIRKRLHTLADSLRSRFPGHQFRTFVDTAPVLEREHAARASLGWIGKHTLLIHPRAGSYLLLGGIMTTLPLRDASTKPLADACGTCTRCIDACPTGAITPYRVDATRCVSYLTIEHRGVIDTTLHPGMGDWIFGCDICQEVCPFNGPRAARAITVNPAYQPRTETLDLLEVLGWTEEDRRRAFARSALKRATLDMMKRNALIAAANRLLRAGDAALLARIREIASDAREPELIRRAARQVLTRLENAGLSQDGTPPPTKRPARPSDHAGRY